MGEIIYEMFENARFKYYQTQYCSRFSKTYRERKNPGISLEYIRRTKTENMSQSIPGIHFVKEVRDTKTLSLVQFKAEWSGACQIIAPVYEELAKHYEGVINFFVIDIDTDKSAEQTYGIHEVPTILFFKDGIIIDYAIGLTSKNTLIEKIENAQELC